MQCNATRRLECCIRIETNELKSPLGYEAVWMPLSLVHALSAYLTYRAVLRIREDKNLACSSDFLGGSMPSSPSILFTLKKAM